MPKIIEYKVINVKLTEKGFFSKGVTENDFTKEVNRMIDKGYQPYGEMKVVASVSGGFMYSDTNVVMTQAMVKYEE